MRRYQQSKQLIINPNTNFSQKFKACKIEKNKINYEAEDEKQNQYVFQQTLVSQQTKIGNKENIIELPVRKKTEKHKLDKINQGEATSLLVMNLVKEKKQQKQVIVHQQIREEEEDLTQLWNQMQEQMKKQEEIPYKQTINEYNSTNTKKQNDDHELSNYKSKLDQNDSNSSFQLSPEQLQKWMEQCNFDHQLSKAETISNEKLSEKGNNQISPLTNQTSEKNQTSKQQFNEWGSWADIVEQLQTNSKSQYNNQGLTPLVNNLQTYVNEDQQFVILDSPLEPSQRTKREAQQQSKAMQGTLQFSHSEKTIRYGPWELNYDTYEIYEKYEVMLVHRIKTLDGVQVKLSKQEREYEVLPLRKINWEINQQRKPEVKSLRSKRNCKMNLLEYGKDFFIFDHFKFAVSPLKENCHMYFGIKTMQIGQNNASSQNLQFDCSPSEVKDILYLPGNGQAFLESSYPSLQQSLKQRKVKKFNILLSLTRQKVAICQRIMVDSNNEKKEVIEIKAYDQFEECEGEYLGIVQTKISNFSQQWYCDTIISIPRKKVYSNKINQKNWQQLKIQLRLSETGIIVAELGIFDAQSSVTNCILFGQNKFSQFMMGTIAETFNQIDYIMRIAGISPVVGFVAVLSRQIFALSQ